MVSSATIVSVTDSEQTPEPLDPLRAALAKMHADQQRMLAGVFDRLITKADLGIDINKFAGTDRITSAINDALKEHYADLGARIVESTRPAISFRVDWGFDNLFSTLDLTGLKKTFEQLQPRNLRGAGLDLDAIFDLMKDEGLPFCLVPDAETSRLLLDAPDRDGRRKVLNSRAAEIFAGCEDVIALCVDPVLLESGALIRSAIGAFVAGHTEAAQTLATVVMDGLVGRYAHDGQIKNPTNGAAFLEDEGMREWFFLLPVPAVHVKTWQVVDSGLFNRNTTVHKVGLSQLTPSNAVQAIMLATSLLGFHENLW